MDSSFSHRSERGYTLTEILIVMVIFALLLGGALPRYLSSRERAFVVEADKVLEDMKTAAWSYYQEHGTWAGLTQIAEIGFVPPGDAGSCWDYVIGSGDEAPDGDRIIMIATGDDTPVKCTVVNGKVIKLQLNGTGSASKSGP